MAKAIKKSVTKKKGYRAIWNAFFWKYCRVVSIGEIQKTAANLLVSDVRADTKKDIDEVKSYLKDNDINFVENTLDPKIIQIRLKTV